MRVLHVIDALAPGGAERMVVELVSSLVRIGVECHVCVTRRDTTLAASLPPSVGVTVLDRRATWDVNGLRRYASTVRDERIDVVHAHGYSTGNFAVLARMLRRVAPPIVLHAHSSAPPPRSSRMLARLGVSRFLATSTAVGVWGERLLGFGRDDVEVLANAIDPMPFEQPRGRAHLPFPERPSRVGVAIANVRPVKDVETLIRALARAKCRKRVGLAIAGSTSDGPYFDRCRELVRREGLEGRVLFLGVVEDISSLLAAADFGVLSSLRETGPVALLEYMAAGLPFVATRVGEVAEAVVAVGGGVFVTPADPEALAGALDAMLALPPDAWERRSALGRDLVATKFHIAQRAEHLARIYRRVSERNGW